MSARIIAARLGFALVALGLAACADTGPIFPTSDRLDPWVSASESADPRADSPPVVNGDRARFHLSPGQRRASLHTSHAFGLGQTYLLGFDIRRGATPLPDRPVTIARLMRTTATPGAGESAIAAIRLDARNGVTAFGRQCIPAAQLTRWHSVELRIAMADDDDGYIELFCDRRPVWAQQNIRTTLPPPCRRAQGCTRPVPRPVRYDWQLGLMSPGVARRPLDIEMKRIFYHRLFIIPNRVGPL